MKNALVVAAAAIVACSSDARAQCRAVGTVVRVPQLSEVSGIAASQRIPDRFWAVNDSGKPVILFCPHEGT
jgi:hypothetical protein